MPGCWPSTILASHIHALGTTVMLLFLCFSSLERRQSSESLALVERPLMPQGQGPFDFRLIVEGNLVGESL